VRGIDEMMQDTWRKAASRQYGVVPFNEFTSCNASNEWA